MNQGLLLLFISYTFSTVNDAGVREKVLHEYK
jgi:hypothetical protein